MLLDLGARLGGGLEGLDAGEDGREALGDLLAELVERRAEARRVQERQGAPDLICPVPRPTARSAMVVSSVSPERWETTAR